MFLNPNLDVLLTTNTNAGTTLRQIAFDKSVQRHLGSALFQERIDRYRRDRGLPETAESFSEKDLVQHFRRIQNVALHLPAWAAPRRVKMQKDGPVEALRPLPGQSIIVAPDFAGC